MNSPNHKMRDLLPQLMLRPLQMTTDSRTSPPGIWYSLYRPMAEGVRRDSVESVPVGEEAIVPTHGMALQEGRLVGLGV